MDKLASYNDGVQHLLVSVDVLSRYIRVQPMKNKSAPATKDAFMKMLQTAGAERPKMVWIDEGKEFEGAFKQLCANLSITRYHTKTVKKAAYAERAIRSLKNLIYRYMEDSDTHRYLPRLQSLVKTMNSRENRSIEMAPKNVTNRDVIRIVSRRHMRNIADSELKPSFQIGDYVRAVLEDTPFRKGYKPQFSREIYQIKQILTSKPAVVTYKLHDKNKRELPGRFYEKQLIHYAIT